MRVNVYNEELTHEIEIVTATPETGKTFVGVRFMLESSPKLHHDGDDDDRSSVTIWADSQEKVRHILSGALRALDEQEVEAWLASDPRLRRTRNSHDTMGMSPPEEEKRP